MTTRIVTALFDDYEEAAKAVDQVEAEGIAHSDIAIVASNEGERHSGRVTTPTGHRAAQSDAVEGAGAGATVGTVLGGGAGLLAGLGIIAIPGLGPVVAAGWLVAALTGAGVGAATGGLLGGLTGAGLTEADAETYAEGVRRGGTLLTVRADETKADRIVALLRRGGAIDLDERAQDWRAQGWTGGTLRTSQQDASATAVGTPAGPSDGPKPRAVGEATPVADPAEAPPTKRFPDEIP